MQSLEQQRVKSSDRSSLFWREVPDHADKMDRKFVQFVIFGHQELAHVAVVTVCANQYGAISERAILEVRSHSAFDLLYSCKLLPILDVQAVCEDVA